MLASLDEASQSADDLQASQGLVSSTDNLTVNLHQILSAADMPPPEFDVLNWSPQPTLIVGLGGLGGKVINRLKRMFAEQPLGAARANADDRHRSPRGFGSEPRGGWRSSAPAAMATSFTCRSAKAAITAMILVACSNGLAGAGSTTSRVLN